MESLPVNWHLVEEWDNNFIFEDFKGNFCVNVCCTERLSPSYNIGFSQLKGDNTLIGYDNGAYTTNAYTREAALQKAYEMMAFIDSK